MINLIAAIGENNELGYDNNLLWKQNADMLRFKELTTNNIVVMGSNTFKSMNLQPLPNRTNIILSKTNTFRDKNVIVYDNFIDLLNFLSIHSSRKEIFIIGGQQIYELFIRYCNNLYITKIHSGFKADTFFPKISDNFIEIENDFYNKDDKNQYDYSFIKYIKEC